MAPCQILIVLLLVLLQFCNCSRQIRAAAEHQSITSGHRLLHNTYMPPGVPPANHDEMAGSKTRSITRLSDEMVEKNPTTELPLSVKKKQKQLNMKLKGREAQDSFVINTSSKLKETKRLRKSLLKSKERRRSFLSSSKSAEESMNSTLVSSSPENQYSAAEGIMEMDYSAATKRPPIHNKISSP